MKTNSWEKVAKWYSGIVGDEGHYYHQHVVIPNSIRLLEMKDGESLIDYACGQGILARSIKQKIKYLGVDTARSLIEEAKRMDKSGQYLVADVSKKLEVSDKFDKAAVILALQNIEKFEGVIKSASEMLKNKGKFLIVINHPCFRIPRQSSWEIDEKNKMEYRRINRYLNPLSIPITIRNNVTWSYHNPISKYSDCLNKNNFAILKIEEWTSDKSSVGGAAKMENRARSEFPLFMAILAEHHEPHSL